MEIEAKCVLWDLRIFFEAINIAAELSISIVVDVINDSLMQGFRLTVSKTRRWSQVTFFK